MLWSTLKKADIGFLHIGMLMGWEAARSHIVVWYANYPERRKENSLRKCCKGVSKSHTPSTSIHTPAAAAPCGSSQHCRLSAKLFATQELIPPHSFHSSYLSDSAFHTAWLDPSAHRSGPGSGELEREKVQREDQEEGGDQSRRRSKVRG